MNRICDYESITTKSLGEMVVRVRKRIAKGWEPHGVWVQIMVRREES